MNHENAPLPVGSIIKIKDSKQSFSIVSQLPITKIDSQKGYFDYGIVPIPSGLTGTEILFINIEDIEDIVFVGYIDIYFQDFQDNYDEIISSIDYPHLSVDDK